MKKKGAIFKKSAAMMAAVVIIQTAVFFFTAAASGVMNSINDGEENGLTQCAMKGGVYLRNEMLRNSAVLDSVAPKLNSKAAAVLKERDMSAGEFIKYAPAVNEYLESASEDLLRFMRENVVDGAFIVICSNKGRADDSVSNSYRGVFFKDMDLYAYYEDNSDIMLLRGSSTVSSHYGIPLDMDWTGEFQYDASSGNPMSFFFEPAKAAFDNPDMSYDSLGYWSGRFTVSGENKFNTFSVISYSVPLIIDGQVYGVAGACFSPATMLSMLPAEEMSSGYMIATSDRNMPEHEFEINAEASGGSAVSSEINKPLTVSRVKNSEMLYSIKDMRTEDQKEYCSVGEVDLYSRSSPYYDTRWLVLATEREDVLYGASKRLESRFISAVVISAVIGIVLSIAAAKLLFSPIEQLAEESEDIRDGDVIPVNERSDYEIYVISKALNKLSESKNVYKNDLETEKERYIIALQATHSDIFEYDCEKDTFTLYRFSDEGEYGKESRSSYENFRSLVENGNICPTDDIPSMLAFIEGKADKHTEVKIFDKDGAVRWNDVNSRVIRDKEGRPLRVIASSADITDKKKAEFSRIDSERRDLVTGLYKNQYGLILAEKSLFEKGQGDYTTVTVSFCGSPEYIEKYGAFCFNGVLEEAGCTALLCKAPKDILWRISSSRIAAFIPEASSDKLWDRIENFLSHIRTLYCAEGSEEIACRIGLSLNKFETPCSEAVERSEKAALAAELKNSKMEYYNGEETEELARRSMSRLMASEVKFEQKDYVITDNIITYVLTVLARASDMRRSVNIVFRKTIRRFGLSRVAMFDIDRENGLLKLYTGCRAYGEADYGVSDIPITENDLSAVLGLIESEEMVVADKHFYINSGKLLDLITKFRGNGVLALLPVTENFRPIGCIMFSCEEDKYTEELSETMRQLSKIVSAYVMRYRSVKDSRARSHLLNKMSDEIRTPVNEIIETAQNAIGSKSGGKDMEEALLAIKRSADSLSGLIDNISEILENGGKHQ